MSKEGSRVLSKECISFSPMTSALQHSWLLVCDPTLMPEIPFLQLPPYIPSVAYHKSSRQMSAAAPTFVPASQKMQQHSQIIAETPAPLTQGTTGRQQTEGKLSLGLALASPPQPAKTTSESTGVDDATTTAGSGSAPEDTPQHSDEMLSNPASEDATASSDRVSTSAGQPGETQEDDHCKDPGTACCQSTPETHVEQADVVGFFTDDLACCNAFGMSYPEVDIDFIVESGIAPEPFLQPDSTPAEASTDVTSAEQASKDEPEKQESAIKEFFPNPDYGEAGDSNPDIQQATGLQALLGKWRDSKGSRYVVSLDSDSCSCSVSTTRPGGEKWLTKKLIRIGWSSWQVSERIVWGNSTYVMERVGGSLDEVRWVSSRGGKDFRWFRDSKEVKLAKKEHEERRKPQKFKSRSGTWRAVKRPDAADAEVEALAAAEAPGKAAPAASATPQPRTPSEVACAPWRRVKSHSGIWRTIHKVARD
mmetsp:Transcript_59200/g.108891  ORF Transcript_59200/g.108891 Transcript_59200/m.108891 type:complete len:478 (-) Transcript_59200:127-1560(-)